MSVLHRQSVTAAQSFTKRLLYPGPASPTPSGAALAWSRRLRLHFPELTELLEDCYDRAAENCERFVNISEVDKYSITCTVCRHFDAGGCISSDTTAANIIKLLNRARQHDSL